MTSILAELHLQDGKGDIICGGMNSLRALCEQSSLASFYGFGFCVTPAHTIRGMLALGMWDEAQGYNMML